ncbi:MAG: AMP-binding protein [Acidilobaceae archaeon]
MFKYGVIFVGYKWFPPRDLVYSSNVYAFMERFGFMSYGDFVRKSTEDVRWFWGNLPEWLGVEWFREPREVVDLSSGIEWAKWYRGGLINLSYNVVDRPVKLGFGGKEAFTWVGEDGSVKRYTYSEFKDEVDRLASFFREIGVKRGDVVSIYAPMLPESIAAMLASIKIGGIASPIFSGFAPSAVAERLTLANSRVIVTVDGYYRRGSIINLKASADEAIRISESQGNKIDYVIVIKRANIDIPWVDNRDYWYHDVIKGKRVAPEPEEMDPEEPSLLLFTSGTTGRPKGAVISHAGALLQPSKEHYFNLDIKQFSNDRLWWITDIGWMMGPWQVIGAQFNVASHLMIEGALDYPERGRVWRLIQEYKVTHFGFAATVARILKRTASDIIDEYDISSIRAFGNTGEPIDQPTWMWVMRDVGREERPIINLSGGTEIFGCFLMPSPVVPLKPSTLWGPALGMDIDVFDDEGRPIRGERGYLVAKKPAPSMTRGLWGEPDRYIEVYWSRFSGVWYHGDYALIDEEGFWYLLGRADDVIKIAGRRIGSAEVEAIATSHPQIAEAACVGLPHEVKGEVLVCFTVPRGPVADRDKLAREVQILIAEKLGKPFMPEKVVVIDDLPRTRSGKITRRVIRDIARGEEPRELSVIENIDAVIKLKDIIGILKSELK